MSMATLLLIVAASASAALLGIWRLADSLMFLVVVPAIVAVAGVVALVIVAVMLAAGVA